jgi:hypothetical protein
MLLWGAFMMLQTKKPDDPEKSWTDYISPIVLVIFCICLPLLQIVGMFTVILTNFIAKAYNWEIVRLSTYSQNKFVDALTMASSYQAVLFFMPLFLHCYFTSGITEVGVGWGFYCYACYCLLSIAEMQLIEILKDVEDEEEEPLEAPRRRLSSILPTLPGLSRDVKVDSFPVLLILLFFFFLIDILIASFRLLSCLIFV